MFVVLCRSRMFFFGLPVFVSRALALLKDAAWDIAQHNTFPGEKEQALPVCMIARLHVCSQKSNMCLGSVMRRPVDRQRSFSL